MAGGGRGRESSRRDTRAHVARATGRRRRCIPPATPLGTRLRERAGPAWAELHAALQEAQEEARAVGGTLRIGCTAFVGGEALSRLVEEFSARYLGCEVTLGELGMWDPYGPLRGGEVDVVVNWLAVDEPDLTVGPVIDYRDRVLAVGSGHRLAGRDSVAAEELADEETHELAPSFPAALGDAIIPASPRRGAPFGARCPTTRPGTASRWWARWLSWDGPCTRRWRGYPCSTALISR